MNPVLDLRDFNAAINRMAELAKREPTIVVRNMARDYTREVIKVTPKAKKTWWKRVELPSGQIVYIRKDKESYPRGTGFAKAGWVKARIWANIQKTDYFAVNKETYAEKYSGLDDRLQDFFASITLENRVPYIGELDDRADIEDKGIAKAKEILDKSIAKFEKKLQEANK